MADTLCFENALGNFLPLSTGHPARARLANRPAHSHRTIFISDTHLGTKGCKAEALADFLAHNDCETLFLVGDIVDGWQLKRRWFWNEAHGHVVAEILRKVDNGTRVIFVPGNHDEFARDYAGRLFGGIEIVNETVHVTADGRKLLVLHGDRFDGVIACAKWLAHLGDWAYGVALSWNDLLFKVRKALGLPYWSLSAWLKHKVKNAVEYISAFEVCGHIHHAEIRMIGDVLYLNDGDWVESCSALVEDAHGNMEILRWALPPQRSTGLADASTTPAPALIPA
jgi:UDP-2,3-diacylglucosamine pyrophosphatase LpxH